MIGVYMTWNLNYFSNFEQKLFITKTYDFLKMSNDYHFLSLPSLMQIRLKLGKYNYSKVLINKNICKKLSLEYRPVKQ